MKIRKFAAVLLALVMVFALAACSDNKPSDNSGNTVSVCCIFAAGIRSETMQKPSAG